jgi:proteasome lid subunit RPN8/RPN11
MTEPSKSAEAARLRTPILYKHPHAPEGPASDEHLYYLVARDGLFIGRNHEFFRSCVPARHGPGALAAQEPFFESRFPRIPQRLLERIVGFFDRISEMHVAEASVLLAWDRKAERVRLVVPEQTAMVTEWSDGFRSPTGLHYFPPADLSRDLVIFGDVHSHVDFSAYSSATDKQDEVHDAGLHLVVGRLYQEPPQFHVETTVDGMRFELTLEDVAEGYEKRNRNVPRVWLERVQLDVTHAWYGAASSSYDTWSSNGGYSQGAT